MSISVPNHVEPSTDLSFFKHSGSSPPKPRHTPPERILAAQITVQRKAEATRAAILALPNNNVNVGGLCLCGCGQRTKLAKQTDSAKGFIRGLPVSFVKGHRARLPQRHAEQTPNDVRHLPDGTSVLTVAYKGQPMECHIDTIDYPSISNIRWHVTKDHRVFYATGYISHNGQRFNYRMHRLILPDVASVDHKDHNGLNNRRSNLRSATPTQQLANMRKSEGTVRKGSSQYKGVFFERGRSNKFRARIRVNGRDINLGSFKSADDAARAYDAAAIKHFGEYAKTNFTTAVIVSQVVAA